MLFCKQSNGFINVSAVCNDDVNRCTCDCSVFYTGITCEMHICHESNQFCQNGGTCLVNYENAAPNCVCPPAYKGVRCNVSKCDVS